MSETGFECTAYFRGRDGRGTCDTECQWWNDGCNMAKGSEHWDGEEDPECIIPTIDIWPLDMIE
jgi:hypothetical protein